ncbi:Glucose-1-phosphate adenylyltransferase [Methylacidimicrobium sp. AP8]|uniref:glucose-1-phosphate adenylyltransferase n=1 Tax=Methylacidimicrobium sp. AP8 TaxID=2730359 RepID=UPI0018C0F781|nr:glucose-1-phosphate adenylyltransferase [Methylacidimicrobium sp. AP8]CAB4242488.1 Glucose-1-phosphate adenylyltransferase [Methylacidimicrobium sp. AP8]
MTRWNGANYSPLDVITVILGGGAGTRLFPLTKERAKPAVPLAGKYRLVDIPISLAIHSDLKRIFILTQFQSSSLHRHIQQSYRFDDYSQGFIELLAAQQTMKGAYWYQGTADAVRQNLSHFSSHPHELVLILAGDQLYRMDFRALIEQHVTSYADLTVAVTPVNQDRVSGFGIVHVTEERRIDSFVEKPKDPSLLSKLAIGDPFVSLLRLPPEEPQYWASTGIYLFNRKVLANALTGGEPDFGRDVIPRLIPSHRVFAYIHSGYWEDIGTIRAFYEANLDLCEPHPKFDFYDSRFPIYTRARYLPSSKISRAEISGALIAEGSVISDAKIEHSLIGIRSIVLPGATIKDSLLLGNDVYETDSEALAAEGRGLPRIGIGRNSFIEGTIVDKNTRIGDNVRISPKGKPANMDGDCFYIRDGLVIIPRGGIVPHGTVI